VRAAREAAGGFVETSGRFTGEARRFADGRNVDLVDGHRLLRMIDRVQAAAGSTGASKGLGCRGVPGIPRATGCERPHRHRVPFQHSAAHADSRSGAVSPDP